MKSVFSLAALLLLPSICACGKADPLLDELRDRGMRFVFDQDGSVRGAYLYGNADEGFTDEEVARLSEIDSIRLLLIESPNITDAALEHVKKLPNLQELDLTFCSGRAGPEGEPRGGITDAGVQHLKEMTQLQVVGLQYTRVTDEGADELRTALPGCEIRFQFRDPLLGALARHDGDLKAAIEAAAVEVEFDDAGNAIELKLIATDAGLKYVANFNELRELALRGEITNEGCGRLAALKKLTVLDLAAGPGEQERQIDDEGIRLLAPLARLQSLNLSRSRMTDDGLKHLRSFQALQKLTVVGCAVTKEGLLSFKQVLPECEIVYTGAPVLDGLINHQNDLVAALKSAAESFEQNPQGDLVALQFKLSRITDSGLEKVGQVESMRRLSFRYCRRITDEGMQHVGRLRNLRSLTLAYTNITSEGLSHLTGLEQLKELDLSSSTTIDEFGLDYLVELENLEKLVLWGAPNISDEDVTDLSRLRNLKLLDLRKTSFTAEGVERLQSRLPDCEILF